MSINPTLDEVYAQLAAMLPTLSPREQAVGMALYQLLARGAPVSMPQLVEHVGIYAPETLECPALKCLTYYDDAKRVIGFGGLAVVPMTHRFMVNGRTLYTWCAWDGLFLPELLGSRAVLESPCPQTGEVVRLTIDPARGLRTAVPAEAVMSFLLPEAPLFARPAEETMTSFCHHIFLFASTDAGATWVAHHEGTFLLSIADAEQLAQMNNAARFGAELSRRRTRVSASGA